MIAEDKEKVRQVMRMRSEGLSCKRIAHHMECGEREIWYLIQSQQGDKQNENN